MSESCEVTVNGEAHPWPGPELTELLRTLEVAPDAKGVAVAVNDEVVPRRRWPEHRIRPGDRVEVVRAVHGG